MTKEFYVTAKLEVSCPDDWSKDDMEEVFRQRLNTHLELNPVEPGWEVNDLLKLDDVTITHIADNCPYRC